jgi:metal-responsive CopG/Arc/MetJ family transcriptional regulator
MDDELWKEVQDYAGGERHVSELIRRLCRNYIARQKSLGRQPPARKKDGTSD